ncbi:MAG: SDR family oxidoreductase [Alphaproteobacteria bacterium]|nr:SDR family oxidoreductase [Alphaproteobacteria bacterium]
MLGMLLAATAHAGDRLKDKVVLITGGSQGIGRGIAEVFVAEGARVMIISRTEANLKKVQDDIRTQGGALECRVADITKEEDMTRVVSDMIKTHGRLDVLIHNAAGLYPFTKAEEMSYGQWRAALETNLDGVFLVTKAVLSQMKKQKYGRIVYTSSISGPRVGLPGHSHYTAAKGGLTGFMKTIAVELARDGITVNAVEPGNVETEGFLDKNTPEAIKERIAPIPMGRFGTTHEIAYAHLFLASDEARYITGQSIIVDGGQTLPETQFGY